MIFKELNSMALDELLSLHEQLASLLKDRISKEKALLDAKQRTLGVTSEAGSPRDGPSAVPKYRNPNNPAKFGPAAGEGLAGSLPS
jgi:hypothetical protein